MNLKDQDFLTAGLVLIQDQWQASYQDIADALGSSSSETYTSLKRLQKSKLVKQTEMGWTVQKAALYELLIHGLKYLYPPEWGTVVRGIPTSISAPILKPHFVQGDLSTVWAHPLGTVRGLALQPIHKRVPELAQKHDRLHSLFALMDAIRAGRVREKTMAEGLLKALIFASTDPLDQKSQQGDPS